MNGGSKTYTPKVSIIVVNYLDPTDTIDCLESIRQLNYTSYNVVIVDNASTEETHAGLRVALADSGLEGAVLSVQTNIGFGAGCNRGADFALTRMRTDYLWFLNNDTLVDRDSLIHLVEAAEADHERNVVSSLILHEPTRDIIWYAGSRVSYLGFTQHWGEGLNSSSLRLRAGVSDYVTGCSALVSGAIWRKVGGFDERYFMYYEDTEWSFRARRMGIQILFEPKSKVYHKVSRSVKRAWNELSPTQEYYDVRNKLLFVRSSFGPVRRNLSILNMVIYRIPRRIARIILHGRGARMPLVYANLLGLTHGIGKSSSNAGVTDL